MVDQYQVLHGIIASRRSVRRFRPEPVPEGDVRKMIECARWAPSATNQQPWRFIAVATRRAIAELARLVDRRLNELIIEARDGGLEELAARLKSFGTYATFFGGAPLLIVCVARPYQSRFSAAVFQALGYEQKARSVESLKSVSLAAQNLLLAAHALGYGACPMSAPQAFAGTEMKAYLGIPPEEEIVLLVPVGRPDHVPHPPRRKEIDEILTWL
ncbi:MAG: nitroreductase family protein [Thermoanaerobacterales bacterium]|nr:nitroreductase family protein [Bacillota bacterium]MDI6906177.1 nitroreductase family protein [Thermoanaerobacterales bacterium]